MVAQAQATNLGFGERQRICIADTAFEELHNSLLNSCRHRLNYNSGLQLQNAFCRDLAIRDMADFHDFSNQPAPAVYVRFEAYASYHIDINFAAHQRQCRFQWINAFLDEIERIDNLPMAEAQVPDLSLRAIAGE